MKTNVPVLVINNLNPVLVDTDKKIVIDTLYGTGKNTYDTCTFLYYDDFIKYRTERIQLHYWYAYDTLLSFAANHYLVHYNFCKFKWDQQGSLFIRWNDPESKTTAYRYIEIPASSRIHLHDYNNEIRNRDKNAILKAIAPFILSIRREEWGLK